MFALDTASRAALAAAAFAAFGAAFVTTPMMARGDAGVAIAALPSGTSLPRRAALADVPLRRDPFAGADASAARPAAVPPQSQLAMPVIPTLPRIPAALRPLPPNAGARDAGFPFATGARTTAAVTAVITGPHPFALVDDGGTTRMLTVGDRIAAETIVAIGADGVRLSSGDTLAVAHGSEAVAPHARPIPGGHTP